MAKREAKGIGRGRKPSRQSKTFYAVVTLVNLLLSVALAVMNRREVIHAVREDENIRLLLTEKPRTEAPK